ncbi:YciI family protein [Lysobacter sp. CCNWLW3]|uniref:YciI family protein n=1 Tax=unclassified Lysobacter TaxID=2635362 RepID=UPI002FCEC5C6
MKYMLMMQFPHASWKVSRMELWPEQDVKAHMDHLQRMNRELVESGEFVQVQGLTGPEAATMVHARADGSPAVTDGPFPESKEFLAGYMIVDVDSAQRAYQIAARWSAGPGPGGAALNLPVEVRQVMEHSACHDA